jgi:hypothetical protein
MPLKMAPSIKTEADCRFRLEMRIKKQKPMSVLCCRRTLFWQLNAGIVLLGTLNTLMVEAATFPFGNSSALDRGEPDRYISWQGPLAKR